MGQRLRPDAPAAEVRSDCLQIRHAAQQICQPLRRGKIIPAVAHVKQHGQAAAGDGAIGFNAAFVVDGKLLEVRVDLQPAQTELHHSVKLLLKAIHARINCAEGKIARVILNGFCQKGICIIDLFGGGCGVGDDAAGDARACILGGKAGHVSLTCDGNAIKVSNGVRGFLGKLLREDMCVDICDFHR